MVHGWAIVALCLGCAGAKPPPTPPVADNGDVSELHWRGMTVLVKRIPHEVIVAGQLYVRGGAHNWTKDNAGIEKLALAVAVNGGTASLDKQAFHGRLASLGAQLSVESGEDYSVFLTKTLTRNWRGAFDLLAQAFLEPAFPPSEVELQRQLMLSELRLEQQEPDALLSRVSHEMFFAGLPQANLASGTPETVAGLSRLQLVDHLHGLQDTSRLLLVVVGDVEPAVVFDWVKSSFANVREGGYRDSALAAPAFSNPRAKIVDRDLPTHYIAQLFLAPSWNDPRMAVGVVAMQSLQEKLFEEVRTKRKLSYAPASGLQLHGIGIGFLYVTAVEPNATLRVMEAVVAAYRKGDIDPVVLEGDKLTFLTQLLLQNESTSGQADLLARAQILGGDWRLSRDLPGKVQRVTKDEVAAFLSRDLVNLQTVVVGNPKDVDLKLLGAE
jgi:predicted Zn-dependent peptidase